MAVRGEEYIRVICSVCQGKYYRKDTVLVKDRYNPQNGRIVCKWDLDQVNPQSYPNKWIKELPVPNPQHLTGPARISWEIEPTDNRVPTAPLVPVAKASQDGQGVELTWFAPENQGSSDIQAYRIQRADPQLSTYYDVSVNNGSPIEYYQDTTAIQSTFYSYRIAAINKFGQGPYSIDFFYPYNIIPLSDIDYLTLSQDGSTLTTSNGVAIRINHTDQGVI